MTEPQSTDDAGRLARRDLLVALSPFPLAALCASVQALAGRALGAWATVVAPLSPTIAQPNAAR